MFQDLSLPSPHRWPSTQPRYEIVVGDGAADLFGEVTVDPGSVFLAESTAFFEGAPVGKPATRAG